MLSTEPLNYGYELVAYTGLFYYLYPRPRRNLPSRRKPASTVAASAAYIHVVAAASPRPVSSEDLHGITRKPRRYNEMAYLVLGEVSATAQAVANTVKRVVILLATVLFLGESMDANKAAGAAVAIGATMMYSIAKSKK